MKIIDNSDPFVSELNVKIMEVETVKLYIAMIEIRKNMFYLDENSDGTVYLKIIDRKREIEDEEYQPVCLAMYISKESHKYMDGTERPMVGFRMRGELDPQPVTVETLMKIFSGELYVKAVFGRFQNAVNEFCVRRERELLGKSLAAQKIVDLVKLKGGRL